MNPPARAALPGAAKRKRYILYGVGGLVALFLLLSPSIFYSPPKAELRVDNHKISLEIVRTTAAQAQGLGGRSSMPADEGMLFVQDTPAVACFWMKGMRFPLDIIWLDGAKKVVGIRPNVLPSTYPKSFCPDQPAKYVVELNAGQARKLGIGETQTLNF